MSTVSLRGIVAGTATFIVLVGLGLVYLNYFGGSITNPISYWLYLLAWVIPGYVAAAIGRSNGVIQGSIIGIIIGVISGGILAVFFNNPPPGVNSDSPLEIGMLIGIPAAITCGLGGLLWHIKAHFASKNSNQSFKRDA